MDIFEKQTGKWYRIVKTVFGLRLERIGYKGIVRAPTNSDLVFDGETLSKFYLPRPETSCNSNDSQRSDQINCENPIKKEKT